MFEMIMCGSLGNKKKPDESYQTEFEAASKLTKVWLFDIFDLDTVRFPRGNGGKLIYHGWMMPPAIYQEFYERCERAGYELINSPEQYQACHWFNGWYPAIEGMTPLSTIVEIDNLRPMVDQVSQFMTENNCAVILKDYVKSLKHNWHEACFIPKEANFLHVTQVLARFLAIKDDMNDLQGNLVVRKFMNLKSIGTHDKSGMPLTKEFRTFVLNGELLPTFEYWSQGSYSGDVPTSSFIEKIASKVYEKTKSNLFTIDVAQLEDGSWTCIEVGDGQVSAVPDHENRDSFFKALLGSK